MIQIRNLTKCFGDLKAVDDLTPRHRPRRVLRLPGPECRRQDHDHQAPRRTAAAHERLLLDRRPRPPARAGGRQAPARLRPGLPVSLRKTDLRGVHALHRRDVRGAAGRDSHPHRRAFERFGLDPYRHELTENLSHGTRQRLVIASALLHDPKVLIIDEPMVGLDPMHARIVKDEFKERSRAGTTIFLSTHQLGVAEELADRIGIIGQGRLIALGTLEELRGQTAGTSALERDLPESDRGGGGREWERGA